MSDDTRPYGYLENATDQGVTADQLFGERAGNVTAHQGNPNFAPATGYSTAPYIPPKPVGPTPVEPEPVEPEPEPEPEPEEPVVAQCRHKGCTHPPVDGFAYCNRHTS